MAKVEVPREPQFDVGVALDQPDETLWPVAVVQPRAPVFDVDLLEHLDLSKDNAPNFL